LRKGETVTRAFVAKSVLLLGIMTLCLAQGCPPDSPAPGVIPNGNGDGGDTTGGSAGTITIEPDDYPDGTELTDVSSAFTLSTALDDNEIASLFEITATDDGADLAPTGDLVFAHHNIGFFNETRRLRIDIQNPAGMIQITFGGGTFSRTEIGTLQAYDANDNLLAEYVTSPLGRGETEVMRVTAHNISWAVAYTQGQDTFGRLDHLVVTIGGN
jgi:hypothetical protein